MKKKFPTICCLLKKYFLLQMISITLLLSGCGTEAEKIIYADISDLEFIFCSGAGAWRTVLYVSEDGSFHGTFIDNNMGTTGKGYPKGEMCYSEFAGKFSKPEKVEEKVYAFEIESLEYTHAFGKEIKDETLYIYSEAYGLTGTEKLYLYLPGTKKDLLPENYEIWIRGYETPVERENDELAFYAIYNEGRDVWFGSNKNLSPGTE